MVPPLPKLHWLCGYVTANCYSIVGWREESHDHILATCAHGQQYGFFIAKWELKEEQILGRRNHINMGLM